MDVVDHSAPVYPIGVVRRLTGLTERQIRYYEQVGLFRPARSHGQRRLFSVNDVQLLMQIKSEMERGQSTTEIRARLYPALAAPLTTAAPRQRLPHYAGGELLVSREPDVEARRAFMARPGQKTGR
jgi:DNA-binding transcriptional MerR regulator